MARKLKMTGCARFFLVMLVIVPLAYFGASYLNGENGIENIKELFGINGNSSDSEQTDKNFKPSEDVLDLQSTLSRLEDEVNEKDEKIDALYREIEVLKTQLQAKSDSLKLIRQ